MDQSFPIYTVNISPAQMHRILAYEMEQQAAIEADLKNAETGDRIFGEQLVQTTPSTHATSMALSSY